MKISEFKINDEYTTCGKDERLFDMIKKISGNMDSDRRINHIVVTENKKPIGVISFRDIVLRLMNEKRAIGDIKVEEIMTTPVVTAKLDKNAKEIFNLMGAMGFRSLPVVDDKENLVGCITINDLAEKLGKK